MQTKTFIQKSHFIIVPTWSVFGQKTKHPEFIGRVRLQEILMDDKKDWIIIFTNFNIQYDTEICLTKQFLNKWWIIHDDFTLMVT